MYVYIIPDRPSVPVDWQDERARRASVVPDAKHTIFQELHESRYIHMHICIYIISYKQRINIYICGYI